MVALNEVRTKPKQRKLPPFNVKLSYDIDKAVVAEESSDRLRQKLGRIWRRKLEHRIWGDE